MLMVVGFESTTYLLGNGLQIVLQDPQAGAAVRDGLVPPPAFVEEVLRFDPPVQYTRRAGYDTSVGGVPVSGRTGLMVMLGAGNRDLGGSPNRLGSTPAPGWRAAQLRWRRALLYRCGASQARRGGGLPPVAEPVPSYRPCR